MLLAVFRGSMTGVIGEVVGIPRECIACRGTAVGSRRYLARLHDGVNDHHQGGKGLATYATAFSAIFVRRDCTHLSKNFATMGYQQLRPQKYRGNLHKTAVLSLSRASLASKAPGMALRHILKIFNLA